MTSYESSTNWRCRVGGTVALAISVSYGSLAHVHGSGYGALAHVHGSGPMESATRKELTMAAEASGTFEVKLTPQDDRTGEAALGRMTIDKQFRGGLEGTSKGQMLTALTDIKGSAGYVAIEKVTGTLQERTGTFVLQHSGTMTRGEQSLTIGVVPDSGTGELAGLSGTMTITIADGKHSYTFEYTLPR